MSDLPIGTDEGAQLVSIVDPQTQVEVNITGAGAMQVDGSGVTQPISAASLPLPTGASTSALQTTGNTTLTAISGQLPATLGQKAMAASMSVAIASDQSKVPTTWVNSTTAYQYITGNGTTVVKSGAGVLRRIVKSNGGTVTIYDNTAGSGTIIHTMSGTNPQGTLFYDVPFTTGLTIVTTSGPDLCVVYE